MGIEGMAYLTFVAQSLNDYTHDKEKVKKIRAATYCKHAESSFEAQLVL